MLKSFLIVVAVAWIGNALYRTWLQMRTTSKASAAPPARPPTRLSSDKAPFDIERATARLESDPEDVLGELASLFTRHDCPRSAIDFAAVHFAKSFNQALNKALIAAITNPSFSFAPQRIDALFEIGASEDTLTELRTRLLEERASLRLSDRLKWSIDNLELSDAIEDLAAAGVFEKPGEDFIEALREDYGHHFLKGDGYNNEYIEPVELLRALIAESPFALHAERYKPQQDVSYLEFFEFVFDQPTVQSELQDLDEEYDSEEGVVRQLRIRVDEVTHTADYEGHNSLDIDWAVEIANRLLEHHAESVRCINPEICLDSHTILVGEPNRIIQSLDRYHLAYATSAKTGNPEQGLPAVRLRLDKELQLLETYAKQTQSDRLASLASIT